MGSRETRVIAVSSLAPPTGIDELLDALAEHRERLDVGARRLASRRSGAIAAFTAEHGERGLRALGGRLAAERLLSAEPSGLDGPALIEVLERASSHVERQEAS
jgi:LAO/AO transport system kinase